MHAGELSSRSILVCAENHRRSLRNGKLPPFPLSWRPLPIFCAAVLSQAFLVPGNVTGVSLYGSEIARKRMEVFKEAVVGIQ